MLVTGAPGFGLRPMMCSPVRYTGSRALTAPRPRHPFAHAFALLRLHQLTGDMHWVTAAHGLIGAPCPRPGRAAGDRTEGARMRCLPVVPAAFDRIRQLAGVASDPANRASRSMFRWSIWLTGAGAGGQVGAGQTCVWLVGREILKSGRAKFSWGASHGFRCAQPILRGIRGIRGIRAYGIRGIRGIRGMRGIRDRAVARYGDVTGLWADFSLRSNSIISPIEGSAANMQTA